MIYWVFKVCLEFMYDFKKLIIGIWDDMFLIVFGICVFMLELWDFFCWVGVENDDFVKVFCDLFYDKIKVIVMKIVDEGMFFVWCLFDYL